MDAIENAAFVSVSRACGFAALGIFTLMAGLSFEPALATRSGGILTTAVAVILSIHAFAAPIRSYKRTELWLILPKQYRPPESVAQKVIGQVLRETYTLFAHRSAIVGAFLLATSIILKLFGFG
jgi:hypothetical protein